VKAEHRALLFSLLACLAFWALDAAMDAWFFYEGTFLELLLTAVPQHEIFFRALAGVVFLAFGVVLSVYLARRRRAEGILRESEERYRSLYASMSEGVCLHEVNYDEAGRPVDYTILDVNPAYESITGIRKADAVGRRASELYGTGRPPYLAVYAKVAETGRPASFETTFEPMGKSLRISVFSPGKGRFATVFEDMTESRPNVRRITHLSDVLRAIRNVNQLITREKDRDALLQGALRSLTESRGLRWAWIALVDASGRPTQFIQTGLDDVADAFSERLHSGRLPTCMQVALSRGEVVVVAPDRQAHCGDCPLTVDNVNEASFTVRLEHGDRTYGVLCTMVPAGLAAEREKRELFDEIAGDMAFALHNIDLAQDREKAERAIRQERDRAQQYLDVAGVIIVVLDSQGRVSLINRRGCEVLGYSQQEILGKGWFELFIPQRMRDAVRSAFDRLIAGELEPDEYYENPVVTRTGQERTIAWHNAVLRDEAGRIRATLSSGEDITKRLRAEKALRETNETLTAVIHSSPLAILQLDANGAVQAWNEAAEQMFGWTEAEVLGQPLPIVPEDRQDQFRSLLDVVLQGQSFSGVELQRRRRDGTLVDVSIFSAPLTDPDGRVFGIVSLLADITDRKRAEQQRRELDEKIQHAQKLESLGVLAGGIAHDFNNLLMGILGNAGLALMELPPESAARASVEQVETAARRAAELTKQMLAYSGRGRFVVRPLDLSRLVEEMAHLLRASIPRKVELKCEFAGNLPLVEADGTQLRQVVMNLITNGADAIEREAGVVTISTGALQADAAYLASTFLGEDLPEGNYVYVEVADNGVGIPAETREKIFDPFFTTKTTGRGLGLAAVLGIVRGHQGAVKVDSEPGRGTTIRVLLPKSRTVARPDGEEAAGEPWQGGGTVLVIDDERTVRSVDRRMLEHAGFHVLTAEDGSVGVELFGQYADEIVVVLLDMTMPRMSGEETFRRIREIKPEAAVILSSGYDEQEATGRFVGTSPAAFIQKPYRPMELVAKVRQVLRG